MRNPALIAALLLGPAIALAATTGRNARLAEQFRRADADGNGVLSQAEAERAAPLLARQFDAIDANRDGQISPEEIRAFRRAGRSERRARGGAQGTQAGAKFDYYFARADTDGDGALSRAEADRGLPRVAKKFERIDRDGDGRLTREEMQAWLAARRAARSGRTGWAIGSGSAAARSRSTRPARCARASVSSSWETVSPSNNGNIGKSRRKP